MGKTFLLFVVLFVLSSCKSANKHNLFLEKKIAVQYLRKDVDFAYQKLQRYHPNLYWYISKDRLDYKFDSIKNSISEPLTPNQFFFKLAPVIASVKEGHLRLKSIPIRYSKSAQKKLKNQKPLFGMLDYKIVDDKLYIIANKENVANLRSGTEILKIDDEDVANLVRKYKTLYSSDGDNKTFQKYFINLAFFNYYTLEKGYLDSVKLQTKCDDIITNVQLKRQQKSTQQLSQENKKQKINTYQKLYDYNAAANSYNRTFKFLKSDSSIAYIKVKSFSASYAKKFYQQTFKNIKNSKAEYLILDIRDNLGGSLSEINTLYSYLTNKKFTLIKPPEMTTKTSGMHQDYFRGQSIFTTILSSPGYPFFLAGHYFLSSKKDKRYYFKEFASRPTKKKENAFQGKIYVLINGASFSASSIIAAKLKYEQQATIVGEETGGANDGTVAGVNNTVTIPNSRLTLPIGLFLIRPNIHFENKNRGVIPDFDVNPDFADIFEKEDKILKWTLDDVKFRKSVYNNIK